MATLLNQVQCQYVQYLAQGACEDYQGTTAKPTTETTTMSGSNIKLAARLTSLTYAMTEVQQQTAMSSHLKCTNLKICSSALEIVRLHN